MLEDYRFLDDPARRSDPFDSYRYHRLSDSAWAQLGGELRHRGDAANQPYFGLRDVGRDDYLQQRAQLHADLHLFDDGFRTFLQLEDTRSWGREVKSPTDQSRSELRQAFVETGALPGRALVVRIGRQEMAYGAQTLVTYRDAANLRQSFDGLRLSWAPTAAYKVDAFAVRPVQLHDGGSFNDGSDNNKAFHGLYATLPPTMATGIDLYGFSLETANRRLDGLAGAERRYTLGTRLFGKHNGWDWSWDLMRQTGQLDGAAIRAWAMASSSGYGWEAPGQPRLGMRIDLASGDGKYGDRRAGTFDPLFGVNGVYGSAGLTTLANLMLVGPTFGFSPRPDLRVEPSVFTAWKQNRADGVYFPGLRMAAGTRGTSRQVGTSYRTTLRWLASANMTLDLDAQFYDVGAAITEAGGKDSASISLRSTLRF